MLAKSWLRHRRMAGHGASIAFSAAPLPPSREGTSPLRNPAAPPLPPTAASPAKPSRNPLCLHLVPARPGFRPVGCASIPDLTLLRRRFARRDATRRDATRRDAIRCGATQRLRDPRRSAADWNARMRRFTLPWIISLFLFLSLLPPSLSLSLSLSLSFACAPRISSKTDRYASNA